jgi:hypothetical protein
MKSRIWLLMTLLILVGFSLRVYHLNTVSLRGDEAFTVIHWMREPLSQTLSTIVTKDPQPPLAYALFRGWALLTGEHAETARILPALLNVIGIPVLFALGKRIGGFRLGLIAAFLWAIHPYQIWHAQDARNYAIWSSASVMALWLALRALEHNRPVDWLLYIIVALSAAYLYYLELFTLAVLNLYVLMAYWRQWKILARWIAAQAAIGLLLAPWFLQDKLLFRSDYGGTTGSNFDPMAILTHFIPTLTFGPSLPESSWVWVLICILLVVGGVRLWHKIGWRKSLLFWLLFVIPPLLIAFISLRLNVFAPRYILSVAPAYVIFLASLCVHRSRGFGFFVFVFCFVGFSLSLISYFSFDDYAKIKSPNWRELIAFIEANTSSDDIVIQRAGDEAFNFYFDEYAIVADRQQLPANERHSPFEIYGTLFGDLLTRRSLWMTAQTFPDWPSAGIVEQWAANYTQQVRAHRIGGISIEQYMSWYVSPHELPPAPLTAFSNIAELAGAEVFDPVENTLDVWLYWRPSTQTQQPFKVFVQLIGSINPATGTPLWSQDDQFPQNGRISTTKWRAGALYRDVFSLPLDGVASGEYSLIVGLYNAQTGERIPVGESDHYLLQQMSF